ncbi:MAG TPA: dienelactone hydrolase family protein [Reyranella sp.]|nr:dienelactone hydrolase family protein [Reyranella sp.]
MQQTMCRLVAAVSATALFAAMPAQAEPTRTEMIVGLRHNINAVLFTPQGPGPFPGIMLLPTADGMNVADENYCRKLAEAGYVCLAHDFIRTYVIGGYDGREPLLNNRAEIYPDLIHVEQQIKTLPKVRPGGIGTIGFSAGGFFALGLASRHATMAAVSYYPALGKVSHTPREVRLEHSFSRESAPVLIFHGTVDHIPVQAVQNIDQAMTEAGAPHELKIYPYAGHIFERDFSQPGNQAAAADAWIRTLEFFKRHMQ